MMTVWIINQLEQEYPLKDLRQLLERFTNVRLSPEQPDRYFILTTDDTLSPFNYRVEGKNYQGRPAVHCTGGSYSGAVSAMYYALEQMGILFDIDGPFVPHAVNLEALDGVAKDIVPFCKHRGIRQHINFPMDISSYHLEDAKEYIRNLARLQMNSITFHSYTGQWHGYTAATDTVLPGNFFYGQRHPVPSYPPIANNVDNRSDYCIPEAEAFTEEPVQRGEYAIYWLGEVMKTCHEVGLAINLSVELPDTLTTAEHVHMVREVIKSYPLLSSIEWITPEGGGNSSCVTEDNLLEYLAQNFGKNSLVNGKLPYFPETFPDALPGTLSNLYNAVQLYQHKEDIFQDLSEIPIHIGLYVTCRETLRIVQGIMKRVLPSDMIFTFLPSHGSVAVADNIAFMDFTAEDLQQTLYYSWIEFDGNMYLQQNSSPGIEQLLRWAQTTGKAPQIYGMCMNHWRTAENIHTIAYAARAMITPLSVNTFYREYIRQQGISAVDSMESVMEELGELDTYNRDNLFNIGFCYLGCWLAPAGLGWIREWKSESLTHALQSYRHMISTLENILPQCQQEKGRQWVRLLINRMETSILQIQAIETLQIIGTYADDLQPEALTDEQKEVTLQHCKTAMDFCRKYADIHVQQMPDRGCQGTIVSYYETIPVYVDHIKEYFVYGEKECHHRPPSFDGPPPPDSDYLF